MIIIWGTRSRQECLGAVGDWCPACASVRPFTVKNLFRVSHIYFIPLGRGNRVATFRQCWQCGSQFYCSEAEYDQLVPEEDAERLAMIDLLRHTNAPLKNQLDAHRQREQRREQETTRVASEAEIPWAVPVDDSRGV
jgi:hypothetical protein